jgi:hypothetical protein
MVMIRQRRILCVLVILSAIALSNAETITAVSDTFSFPSITGIKNTGKNLRTATYFSCLKTSSKSAGMMFAWSFPSQALHQKGNISIYSPMGRIVKAIPVSSNSGCVAWNVVKERAVGVYIAKITYGASKQSAKFFIF